MAAASKSCVRSCSDDDDIMIIGSHCPGSRSLGDDLRSSQIKKTASKRSAQWVAPSFDSFDGFDDFSGTQKRAKSKQTKLVKTSSFSDEVSSSSKTNITNSNSAGNKRLFTGRNTQKKSINVEDLWSDKYSPSSKPDLAVHTKKVGEVEAWLTAYQRSHGKMSPLLLLTGPAGCGKTATIKALCSDMGLEIQEWLNPLTSGSESKNREDWSSDNYRKRFDFPESESQVKTFQDFLLRANKYQKLEILGGSGLGGKAILVEDFPNLFYKDTTSFHEILRRYRQQGKCPLVFVVSDSASGQSNERLLFPPDIQTELDISNIAFNPVALTLLTKLLTRVASSEASNPAHSGTFVKPSPVVIESISMSCSGDIRGAINSLQFSSLRGRGEIVKGGTVTKATNKKPPKGKSSSKSKAEKSSSDSASQSALGSRDTSMFLFRALGKILYAKRDPADEGSKDLVPLPIHLKCHERDPLQFKAEDVIDRCHISGDFFNAYLHQNYVEFFSSVEDLERSSEYFSDTDFMTSSWASKSVLEKYSSCVAARGLMHSNSCGASSSSGRGWKPLHKPQLYGTVRKTRNTVEIGKSLFRTYSWTPEVLFTELLPYISLVNITLHSPKQIGFLQEVCRFAGLKGPEKLDDKEGQEIEGEDDSGHSLDLSNKPPKIRSAPVWQNEDSRDSVISNSQTTVKVPNEDEEIDIEEFDFD